MKVSSKKILSILLTLSIAAGLLALMPVFSSAANTDIVLNQFDSLGAIQDDINYAISRAKAGDTITIKGKRTGVEGTLDLNIPAGVTVVWAAEYEGAANNKNAVSWERYGNVYMRQNITAANNAFFYFMPPASGRAYAFAQRTGSAGVPEGQYVKNYGYPRNNNEYDEFPFAWTPVGWAVTAGSYYGPTTGSATEMAALARALDFYMVIDRSKNDFTGVFKLKPLISDGTITRTGFTSADISLRSYVPGEVYYLALEAGSAAPSGQTVRYLGKSLGTTGTIGTAGGYVTANKTITDLPAGDVDIYVVVRDTCADNATLDPLQLISAETSYPMKLTSYNTALINNTGVGSLVVADGAKITANADNGVAIYSAAGNVTVNGGLVEAKGNAIRMTDNDGSGATGNIVINGGEVKADGIAVKVSDAYKESLGVTGFFNIKNGTASVRVSGGKVTGGDVAIEADNCVVTVSGNAAIKATGENGFGVAFTRKQLVDDKEVGFTGNGRLAITGGTIEGYIALVQNSDVAIQGGTLTGGIAGIAAARNVTVSGGKVEAVGAKSSEVSTEEVSGAAIMAEGNVNVSGGTVKATIAILAAGSATVSGGSITGTACAIAAGGNVTVSGGAIEATAANGVAIAAETGTLIVTGGTVTASDKEGAALYTYNGIIAVVGGTVTGKAAILVEDYGAAAVYAGSCTGKFEVSEDKRGIIAEVTPAFGSTIDAECHLKATGLKVLAGREDLGDTDKTSTALWDCTGANATVQLSMANGRYMWINWGNISGIVLSNGTAVRTGDEDAKISFNTGIGGAAYYFVQDAGAGAIGKPTAKQLADDWTKLADNVAPGMVKDKAVTLPSAGAKGIFVVVVDGAGNISFPLKIYAAPYAQKFSAIVNNGSGGGSYAAGEPVFISAVVPAGKTFLKWTVVSGGAVLENANDPSTKFTMPANAVTVRADFAEGDEIPDYILSTKYEKNFWNWFKFIVLFGWIWMWIIPPTR